MEMRSTRSSPCARARLETSAISRTPHAGSRAVRLGIEVGIAWRGVAAVLLERPIKIKHATGRERPSGPRHQSLRRGPWCNVDHIDRNHGVGASHGPGGRRGVEFERSQQVRQSRRGAVFRDALTCAGIAVRGLPGEMGQSGGEMHSMLAGTACDLQHDAPSRQDPLQDGQDRFAVARNRRGTGGAIRENDHLNSRFSGATAATISINGRPAMCRPETLARGSDRFCGYPAKSACVRSI